MSTNPAAQAQALFLAYLPRLGELLRRAQVELPASAWRVRLAPDMLPLLVQAEVAIGMPLRTHAALQGQAVDWGPPIDGVDALRARLRRAISIWQSLPPVVVPVCRELAGEHHHEAPPEAFVQLFALPNYLFHHAQVHALLRHLGLSIGKADFDGAHCYAPAPAPTARPLAATLSMRLLSPPDAAAFQSLRLAALNAHPEAFAASADMPAEQDPAQAAERLRPREGHAVWGLWRGNALLGMAALGRENKPKLAHKAWLWGVYVHPAARSQGGGEALVRAAIAQARAWGLAKLLLGVHADNTAAIRLYQRLGFSSYALERDFLRVDGAPQDEWQMELRL